MRCILILFPPVTSNFTHVVSPTEVSPPNILLIFFTSLWPYDCPSFPNLILFKTAGKDNTLGTSTCISLIFTSRNKHSQQHFVYKHLSYTKIRVFWGMTSCLLLILNQHFRKCCCLQPQCRSREQIPLKHQKQISSNPASFPRRPDFINSSVKTSIHAFSLKWQTELHARTEQTYPVLWHTYFVTYTNLWHTLLCDIH